MSKRSANATTTTVGQTKRTRKTETVLIHVMMKLKNSGEFGEMVTRTFPLCSLTFEMDNEREYFYNDGRDDFEDHTIQLCSAFDEKVNLLGKNSFSTVMSMSELKVVT